MDKCEINALPSQKNIKAHFEFFHYVFFWGDN
jgi:hypothetical protein